MRVDVLGDGQVGGLRIVDGKNYGHKGIITAYWVNGHIKLGECSGRD
ncbi:hypothetical protein [Streptomyces rimosus]|nr:hypothetical protein [Streptomyces rimosus]